MASLTRWTWVWVNSGSWWWTGRPGLLRFIGSQRVGHDWATKLNWTELNPIHEGSVLKNWSSPHLHMSLHWGLSFNTWIWWEVHKNSVYNSVGVHVCLWVLSLSHVWLFATPWAIALQIHLSMGFSKQGYWSGLLFPSPGDLPNPGIEPTSPGSLALADRFFTTEPCGKHITLWYKHEKVNFFQLPPSVTPLMP